MSTLREATSSWEFASGCAWPLWAAVQINCWCLVRKYRFKHVAASSSTDYRIFGGPYRFTVFLFESTQNNAKMQWNWLHGFRSLNCREWIKGALVVFAFAAMLGSYLSTFLDSFLSKETLRSQLQTRMTGNQYKINISMKRKRISLWSNESIPRPGSLFQQKVIARLSLRLSLN